MYAEGGGCGRIDSHTMYAMDTYRICEFYFVLFGFGYSGYRVIDIGIW